LPSWKNYKRLAKVIVTSANNARIVHIRGLIDRRKARTAHRQFFVEGVRAISGAYYNGWQIDALIYCPDTVHSDWAREIIGGTDERVHLQVNAYLQARLSQRTEPSEVMAVVAQAKDDLGRVSLGERLLVLLADRPQSPGNLGSLIRSADALGVDALLIIGHAADLYAPRTVRASMGSLFALPAIRVDSLETLENWLEIARDALGHVQVVGTSAHGDRDLFAHDLTGPTVIVLGNEMKGMSHRLREMCDVLVSIPMLGSASSLNVTAAASIVLYEVLRQRKLSGVL
jgi:tRNA G18 (ribose-2'-O)-methylase SpoU